MARFGAEAKPRWAELPRTIKDDVAHALGSRVARATRIYGGYAPSATFRLVLDDGRRAFFKGVGHATTNDFMRQALRIEERVYRELREHISPWAPEFLGSVERNGWHALLLEDLGPADVPPWPAGRIRTAAREFAAFHDRTRDGAEDLPAWLSREEWLDFSGIWGRLEAEPAGISGAAQLAQDRAGEAEDWLTAAMPALRDAAESVRDVAVTRTLLHMDTRSDNVRVSGARLRIFDWNWASVGPPEFDVAAFAEGITADGGPAPEHFVGAYAEHGAVDGGLLRDVVAGFAAYFCAAAWRPPPPELPRVRAVQRRQLKVCVRWAARLLRLPEPDWTDAVPD